MNFDEWFTTYYNYQREYTVEEYVTAQAAWDYQQGIINELEAQLDVADIRPMEESEYLERIADLGKETKFGGKK